MEYHRPHIYGVVAEFDTPEQLLEAVKKVREAGYQRMDAFSPFPIESLPAAMGLKRNHVPLITLLGGLAGGIGGFGFQYWVAAVAYPMNIGGRPLHSWPSFVPVTFELTVLGASLCAVFGMLALNRLPHPHHPLFGVQRFVHATSDRFYLCIESNDPKFHMAECARLLQDLQARHVIEVPND